MAEWVQCRCKALFQHEDDNEAWAMHARHAESWVSRGEGGMHGVVASGKPLTYPEPPASDLASTLNWMALVVHNGYHHEAGGYETCSQITCMAAALALGAAGYEVPMPGVLPEVRRAPGVDSADPGASEEPA